MLRRLCLSSIIVCSLVSATWAQGTEQAFDYSLPAASLTQSVTAISQHSGIQVIYESAPSKELKAAPINGHFTAKQALDKVLVGSGLTYEFINSGTVVIRKSPGNTADGKQSPASARNKQSSNGKADGGEEPTVLNSVSVTGTRIRGGDTASQTIVIDDQRMKEEGLNDLGEVIRSISQNYRGGQNPGVTAGASAGGIANQNMTGGSALNLRGLGPDATLTLLNGRRLSYDGFVQAVDISQIPLEAVERIEVVPDGASAIYGSDAVAGVANVVLKRDFDGVTLSSRYGSAADGGLTAHEYSATAGTTWPTGGVIATFKTTDQDPIYATQRAYTRAMDDPTTIYSGTQMRSGLLSAHQSIGDSIELRLDALRTTRDLLDSIAYPGYYYLDEPRTIVSLIAPSIVFSLPNDWSLTTSFTSGKDRNVYKDYMVTGGVPALQARGCYCNKSRTAEASAEGPLFHLGQNEVRLAVGAGTRTDDFLIHSYTSGHQYGGEESSRYVYGELAVPIVSPEQGRPGLQRLELSLAARAEDYDSFGRVTTPKVGLVYDPSGDYTLKASWGRSFKAPTLLQQYSDRIAYLWNAQQLGGAAYPAGSTVLMSYGGNPNLKPERARTSSVTLAFHPEAIRGLDAELSYFDIDYTDRVAQPFIYLANTLRDPSYAPFVTYSPTSQQQQDLLSQFSDTFYNYASAPYDPSKVVAIARDEYVNVGQQQVSGVDFTGSYRFDLGVGQMQLRGSASWLESSQKNGPGQKEFDLAGTIYHPAKWNSRFGAVWRNGGFSASAFVNFTQGVISTLTSATERTASFTTFDTTLRYETAPGHDALSGVMVALSAQNLFNKAPPLYTPPYSSYVPFDSTNYSAIGRYVSLSVAKHWQ